MLDTPALNYLLNSSKIISMRPINPSVLQFFNYEMNKELKNYRRKVYVTLNKAGFLTEKTQT